MLQHMADEETRGGKRGRVPGLQAARDAFYRGDIAATIARFYQENGGLLTREDLAGFRVGIEPPVTIQIRGIDLYGCGPWCQGPMLLQALSILDGIDLAALGHNSAAYVHALVEAIKLAAADRHAYYGDPRFVDVPMQALLSKAYGAARHALIDPDCAIPGLATAGEVPAGTPPWRGAPLLTPAEGHLQSAFDTSYVCAVDRFGNAFSATPSDPNFTGPVVPGTGSVISTRGDSSWTDPTHPACIAPGKRPRLTCNPALAVRDGRFFMPFGTPGGDVQTQAMLQVFLQSLRIPHGPAKRGGGAALRQLQLRLLVRAARGPAGPARPRTSDRRGRRRVVVGARPPGGVLVRPGQSRGLGLPRQQRHRDRPEIGCGRFPPDLVRDRALGYSKTTRGKYIDTTQFGRSTISLMRKSAQTLHSM